MFDRLRAVTDYEWLGLGIFWLLLAITAKRAARTQSFVSRLLQVSPEVAAFFLLFGHFNWPHWLRRHIIPENSTALAWTGLALTSAGVAFAVWARFWIGRNWSGRVTIKEQHELIQSGPYAIVRHPIYMGLLLAVLGTAIIHGDLCALLAFPMAVLGWTFKLRQEESFMAQQFGPAYLEYKRRVKALIPFLL